MDLVLRFIARLLGTALLACACGSVWADLSREDAANVAQRLAGGGRVLAVERVDAAGRAAWRAKVLTPRGEVRIILIDAVSGRPL